MPSTFTKPKKALDVIILDIFKKSAIPIIEEKSEALAEEIRQELIDRIEEQSFKHKKLNDDYLKYKKKQGLDTSILMATHQYIDAIQVEKTPYGFTVGVGDTIHEPLPEKGAEPLEMKTLANILEFGSITNNIPARPHWRPTLSKLVREQGRIKREWTQAIQRDVDRAYKEYNREQATKKSDRD